MTSIGTQTTGWQPNSFTPLTCFELISNLTYKQRQRELKLILDDKTLKSRDTEAKQVASLVKYYSVHVRTDNDKQAETIRTLTNTFSRHTVEAVDTMKKLKDEMAELEKGISIAKQMITTLHQTPPSATQAAAATTSSPPPSLNNSNLTGNPGTVRPFVKHTGAPLQQFSASLLDKDTTYDRVFHSRSVAYYGTQPYKYPGGHHPARELKENPYLQQIALAVNKLYPNVLFNSALVTKYDSHLSHIPPHSDNEPSIAPGSNIITVSLGGSRQIVFRRKPPGEYCREVMETKHGEVYVMTRESQDYFDHAVPRIDQTEYTGPRLSITFRVIRQTPTSPQSRTDDTTPNNTSQSKRKVLILSDSKNKAFDVYYSMIQ